MLQEFGTYQPTWPLVTAIFGNGPNEVALSKHIFSDHLYHWSSGYLHNAHYCIAPTGN